MIISSDFFQLIEVDSEEGEVEAGDSGETNQEKSSDELKDEILAAKLNNGRQNQKNKVGEEVTEENDASYGSEEKKFDSSEYFHKLKSRPVLKQTRTNSSSSAASGSNKPFAKWRRDRNFLRFGKK